jgi:transcriptional regulator with XRE-family HTH domain
MQVKELAMSNVLNQVGKRVRELRKARKWSQEELGTRARLHPTYVGGIERGERNLSLTNLAKLADAFNLPLSELLSFSGEEPAVEKGLLHGKVLALLAGQDRLAKKFISTYCRNCMKLQNFQEFRLLLGTPDE